MRTSKGKASIKFHREEHAWGHSRDGRDPCGQSTGKEIRSNMKKTTGEIGKAGRVGFLRGHGEFAFSLRWEAKL